MLTPDFIEVTICTDDSKTSSVVVKKFQKNLTVWDLKQRLELITGRNARTMVITVLTNERVKICELLEDSKSLSSYCINNGMQLLVKDPAYESIDVNDDEVDKRYQLSEEDYAKKRGTLKEFLKRNELGKYDPEIIQKKEIEMKKAIEERKLMEEKEREAFDAIEIGQRCQVTIPNQVSKRGVVLFKGNVKFANGLWIGVQYDEPLGKNDGSVNGIKYFETLPNYGAFVKPMYVETGDFPEIKYNLEIDEEF